MLTQKSSMAMNTDQYAQNQRRAMITDLYGCLYTQSQSQAAKTDVCTCIWNQRIEDMHQQYINMAI